tara:strand:- start:2183 stop:2350 length:168 start_codon:yes stop_codon:yes gene_type:complete
MFQIDFFPLYGIVAGINYSNEEMEGMEVLADDKRHTIQFFLFVFGMNFHWFTLNE